MWQIFSKLMDVEKYIKTNLSTSRVAKIDNADATVSSRSTQTSVDSVKTVVDANAVKIGTNADVSGSSTIFARLKQIYDLVSKVNWWEDYTTEIKGSYNVTTKGSYTDIINVSGTGALVGAFILCTSQEFGGIQIEIDGVIVFQAPVTYSSGYYITGLFGGASVTDYFKRTEGFTEQYALPYTRTITDTASPYGTVIKRLAPIRFNSSLIIRGYRSSSSVGTSIQVIYDYFTKS